MYAYLSDKEFGRILDGIDEEVLNLSETTRVDPGKTVTSAVRSPTSPRPKVATLAVAEGSSGYCRQVSPRYEPTLIKSRPRRLVN